LRATPFQRSGPVYPIAKSQKRGSAASRDREVPLFRLASLPVITFLLTLWTPFATAGGFIGVPFSLVARGKRQITPLARGTARQFVYTCLAALCYCQNCFMRTRQYARRFCTVNAAREMASGIKNISRSAVSRRAIVMPIRRLAVLSGLIYRAPICGLLISPTSLPVFRFVSFLFSLFRHKSDPRCIRCRCVTSRSLLSRRRIKMRRADADG